MCAIINLCFYLCYPISYISFFVAIDEEYETSEGANGKVS